MKNELLSLVAELLTYPNETHDRLLLEVRDAARPHPRSDRALAAYSDEVSEISLSCLQEFYSATFELSPKHTLDSSFHIYDGYNRTKCLAKLAEMYRVYEFSSAHTDDGELPDYLPTVLGFVAALEDRELRRDFCANYLVPSLTKLKDSLADTAAPHRHLIDAAYNSVEDISKGGM